jgi:hypothetical protein
MHEPDVKNKIQGEGGRRESVNTLQENIDSVLNVCFSELICYRLNLYPLAGVFAATLSDFQISAVMCLET